MNMQKKQWKDTIINKKQMATAIFEYLEKRNFCVNRKVGIKTQRNIGGFDTGCLVVKILRKSI